MVSNFSIKETLEIPEDFRQSQVTQSAFIPPAGADLYRLFRFIQDLIENNSLHVRRITAFNFSVGANIQSKEAFVRPNYLKENTIQVMTNCAHIILPTQLPYDHLTMKFKKGVNHAQDIEFRSHQQYTKALNNPYILTTEKAFEIKVMTKVGRGMGTLAENNVETGSSKEYTPFVSNHTLWENVVIQPPTADGVIPYRLTGLTSDAFLQLLHALHKPYEEDEAKQESIENKNRKSPSFWSETVMNMQQHLEFSPSDKKAWTALRTNLNNFSTLGAFEAVCIGDTLEGAVCSITVRGVTPVFARKVLGYLEPLFEERKGD